MLLQNLNSFCSFIYHTDNRSEEDDMNDRDNNRAPDADRTEGSMKNMGGNLKEGVGGLLGDEKMKREGQGDQAEGKIQNAWGGIKDKAREITGSDNK